jgi:peptidoglycan/LPS O-acetylase OafA/YrhL
MSPTLARVSYTLAILAGLIAFWVAGCSPVRDDILERIFSLTTQISSLALAGTAIVVTLPPATEPLLQGRRRRVAHMSAALAVVGIACAIASTAAITMPWMGRTVIALAATAVTLFVALMVGVFLSKV